MQFLLNLRSSIALSMVETAFVIPSNHPRLLEGEAHKPVLSQTSTKEIARVRSGTRPSNPSVRQCCVQKLLKPEAPVWWRLLHSAFPLASFLAGRGTCHH